MGRILPQFLQEPIAGELCDFVQRARFLEEVGRARNDFRRAVSRILSAPPKRGRESFVSAASTRNLFRRTEHGASRSSVSYLALHPMGFSVPCQLPGKR